MSFSNPLLSSLLNWFVVSSRGPHVLSLTSSLYHISQSTLPLKTPYISIFPSTADAPKAYVEGIATSARNLTVKFTANGRNVEFYAADRYIETMKGTKDGDLYTYELSVPKPSFPIMAKILSTPKTRDAGGKLVKVDAFLSSFSLSVNVNSQEDAIPSLAPRGAAAAASQLPPDVTSMVAMAYSTIQSLERRVTQLESESTRKSKVISALQKGMVELKVQLSQQQLEKSDPPPTTHLCMAL